MFVLSLEGVYSSILYVSFHSKMQKKNYCVSTGKKMAQQAWKIAQTCLRRLRIFPTTVMKAKSALHK